MTETGSTATGSGAVSDSLLGAIATVWTSFSLRLVAIGVAFVLAGYVLQTGVWAGLLPVWGVALIAVGSAAFAVTKYTYR